ncbi:hypothetical protein [Paraburkholderia silvatlantica]|uniref:hypothetical protein n=1 Tax=Paraburkholderia silvatlantica TaxID=321895 RepID=UPI000DA21EB3|nr:hypothetical protein [Paraburkholderia silvatlantica]
MSSGTGAANAVALALRLREPERPIDEALKQWGAVKWRNGVRLGELGIDLGRRIMGELSRNPAP